MRFGVLGPVAVWDDAGAPVAIPEAKVRALLADLLVRPGAAVSADRLIEDLWGGRPPGNPANALQAKVSMLRRVLGRDRVVRETAGYRLALDAPDTVDAERFTVLATRARTMDDPRARAAVLSEALDLWRGPAFADVADQEFARTAADRLDDQRLAVLEERAEARLAAGEHLLLAGELGDLVARHPLRERLRAVHARALYLAGRQGDALATLSELRELLADELGVDPGPDVAALQAAILRQDPSLTPAVHLATAPEQRPAPETNLPVPLTGLVGRDECLSDVVRLLDATRLVTLVGPGGVGKTRLAVESARAAARPDGTWLVELTAWHGGVADLAQHVAAVLGVRDELPGAAAAWGAAADPAGRLAGALRDRRVLLVLDNCEHVVEEAAELVA
ncbi:BTAD domain-containing putative transcriptional regulator, partial [Spirillospora sp. NPDC049652]